MGVGLWVPIDFIVRGRLGKRMRTRMRMRMRTCNGWISANRLRWYRCRQRDRRSNGCCFFCSIPCGLRCTWAAIWRDDGDNMVGRFEVDLKA